MEPDPISRLTERDAHLAAIVSMFGSPPPFRRPARFETLILLVLEQQVSLDSARAAFDRLIRRTEPTPANLLGLSDAEMREIGFSRQKTRYAREIAARVLDGSLDVEALGRLDDDHARRALTAIPGIGPWTADVFLMSSLRRQDVWPVGDRALQVATAEALGIETPTAAELEAIGERWRPHRSTAARILWHGYLSRRNRTAPDSL